MVLFIILLNIILIGLKKYDYKILIRINFIILLYSSILILPLLSSDILIEIKSNINIFDLNTGIEIYNGLLNINRLKLLINVLINIIIMIILLLSESQKIKCNLILLFLLSGLLSLIYTNDLITFYLAIELQSFPLYILTGLNRNSQFSTESSLKYYFLGALSSALLLLGCIFIYGYTGLTNIKDIEILIINQYDILIGCLLITIALLFKLAAAPFHFWAPNIYDGVPTIITTALMILPKLSIITFMINFYYFITYNIIILLLSSFLSLIIGSILGITQYRIKKLLTYSSISHVGFILLTIILYIPSSNMQIFTFNNTSLFYILQYTLSLLLLFLLILIFPFNQPLLNISQFKGFVYSFPFFTLSFFITLFSLSGIPPFIGFYAKLNIIFDTINSYQYMFTFLIILTSIISTFYYLRLIKLLNFDYSSISSINSFNSSILNFNSFTNEIFSFFITFVTFFICFFFLDSNTLPLFLSTI